MRDNRTFSSKLDRRVEFSKPSASAGGFNENVAFDVVYSGFPAHRKDSTSKGDESQSDNLIQGVSQVEWEIRFLPGLAIHTNWQLKDLHDGKVYKITAPPVEIGRRQGIRIVTEIVQ